RLNFANGAELTHVGGDHDATTVAFELLNTIQSAIQAGQTVGTAAITRQGKILAAKAGTKFSLGEKRVWTLVETSWIKPGLYRLNKPWEMEGQPQPTGCGLLAQLGLPVVTDVALVPPPN